MPQWILRTLGWPWRLVPNKAKRQNSVPLPVSHGTSCPEEGVSPSSESNSWEGLLRPAVDWGVSLKQMRKQGLPGSEHSATSITASQSHLCVFSCVNEIRTNKEFPEEKVVFITVFLLQGHTVEDGTYLWLPGIWCTGLTGESVARHRKTPDTNLRLHPSLQHTPLAP